jgi:hypothetical protein
MNDTVLWRTTCDQSLISHLCLELIETSSHYVCPMGDLPIHCQTPQVEQARIACEISGLETQISKLPLLPGQTFWEVSRIVGQKSFLVFS